MTGKRRAWMHALAGALTLLVLHGGDAEAARPRARPKLHAVEQHRPHAIDRSHAVQRSRARSQPERPLPIIVIDPGHGGADPGAISRSGTFEKTVTLAAARQLARGLTATGRFRVLLTRHSDRFISLADRLAFGPAHGAALVISLHADAAPDARARGASVYVRSAIGLGTGLKRVAGGTRRPAAIASALAAARRPDTGATWLQRVVIDSLDDDIRMTSAPAREAHLWVLASRTVPSVLVEMGFLTNRRDEKLLCDPRHQRLVARSLQDAVERFFRDQGRSAASQT